MRFFWRLIKHTHTSDGRFDGPMKCTKCMLKISWNGEWNYWWTKKEEQARQKQYDDWLSSLTNKKE